VPEHVLERCELLTGQSGTHAIRSLIDRGGLRAVYDGQWIADKTWVAIKLLHGGRLHVVVNRADLRTLQVWAQRGVRPLTTDGGPVRTAWQGRTVPSG
jgi:hypothetical protein